MKQNLKHFLKLNKKHTSMELFIGVFMILGATLLLVSHAATPYASIQASNGSLASGAISKTDPSGESYVQFGASTLTSVCQSGPSGPMESVASFGAKANTTSLTNVNLTITGTAPNQVTTVTTASPTFSKSDEGKYISVSGTAMKSTLNGISTGSYESPIVTYVNPTTVILGPLPVPDPTDKNPTIIQDVMGQTAIYGSDDSGAFTAAIAAAVTNNGYVSVPVTTSPYFISSEIIVPSGVAICGEKGTPTLIGGTRSGYIFRINDANNSELANMTLDLYHQTSGSGIGVAVSSNLVLASLNINNVTEGWGMNIGLGSNGTTTINNTNLLLENCEFSGFDSTFEQLLLYNSANVTITNNVFGTAMYRTSGAGLGLYQNDNDIDVTDNMFGPGLGYAGSYYSVSVNNVTYDGNHFIGESDSMAGDDGIHGANESDHGLFGLTAVSNISVINNSFTDEKVAVQLGADDNAIMKNNTLKDNGVALLVNDGNLYGNPANPMKVETPDNGLNVTGNTFTDNGVDNLASPTTTNATTILVQGITANLGATFNDNTITVPIASTANAFDFNGSSTWDGLNITSNTFSGSTSQFLAQTNGAILGSSDVINNN